jgi:hypothetical protein
MEATTRSNSWPRRAAAWFAQTGKAILPDAGVATGRFAIASRDVAIVLLGSGLVGLFLGLATGWQVAIESAQVVAGVVTYPEGNPFAMYHIKTWTLLHQIPAALLLLGVPERALALAVAGLAGMLSFQALALCALAVGAHRFVAIMTPLALLGSEIYGEMGSVYPIRILSNAPWVLYGCVGTSLAVLIWALAAVNCKRPAALLMGLAPAIHPTMGAWCAGVGLLAAAWNWKDRRDELRGCLKCFLIGVALASMSLAVQLYLSRNVPDISNEEKMQYIAAFAANWDSHRKPFPLDHIVLVVAGLAIAVSGIWLRYLADRLPHASQFLLRATLISGVISILLCISTQWQEDLPMAMLMAMPGRYINVVGLAFPAICIGLIYRHRATLLGHLSLAAVLSYLLLCTQCFEAGWVYAPSSCVPVLASMFMTITQLPHLARSESSHRALPWLLRASSILGPLGVMALAVHISRASLHLGVLMWFLFAITLVGLFVRRLGDGWIEGWIECYSFVALWACVCFMLSPLFVIALLTACTAYLLFERRREIEAWLHRYGHPEVRRTASLSLGVATAVLLGFTLGRQVWDTLPEMNDWNNNSVYEVAHRGDGLLLTGANLRATQLRTRRPVLLEGPALNQLPYVPASGPAMNEILKHVYGDDLFSPRPAGWRRAGGLHRNAARAVWEYRDLDEWQQLARQFGFTQIMTSETWNLKLPVVARSRRLVLYDIPGVEPVRQALSSSEDLKQAF